MINSPSDTLSKMYLVDVSSMIFRAFYAIRPLTSPSGLPVNAIYGFLSMTIKLIKEEKPDYLVFCYDRKEPSFRKEIYSGYKANRSEMPEDLSQQMPYIMKVAPLLGIPSVERVGYEADDLIGSLVSVGRSKNLEVVIVSGDKDFGQLIRPHVTMYDTMKDVRYNEERIKEKWGVSPNQFTDYLAIVGDASDNIPGVDGVGPKGAVKLLEQFQSLEKIFENIDQVSSKSTREKLLKSKENAFLAKKLVTIHQDIALSQNLHDYEFRGPDSESLREFLHELNFKNFEKILFDNGLVLNRSSNDQVPDKAAVLSIDPERVNSSPYHFSEETLEEIVINLKPEQQVWGFLFNEQIYVGYDKNIFQVKEISNKSLTLIDEKKISWRGFNLKKFWHRLGDFHPKVSWDNQLAAYVCLSTEMSDFLKVYEKVMGEALPNEYGPQDLLEANLKLEEVLVSQLQGPDLEIYETVELPLMAVLYKMEKAGIQIDIEVLKAQSIELSSEISHLEKEIQDISGESFNVSSPKQLGQILFSKLGLPVIKKTKTGLSTDNEVLEKLDHPIAQLVLKHRELSKLRSTYVDALPLLVNKETGRIHTNFNQTVTTTGRLSSTNPNLQNIPIRTERGRRIRRAFVAPQGMKLLSVDYSQIELRILAHISGDPGLCFAFENDLDIHAATASEIFSVDLQEVSSDQRRSAKAVNFGIAYGQGAFGLSENLGISRGEAQKIIDRYFQKFSGVQEYITNTVQTAHEKGFVETIFGRRRFIHELKSSNGAIKKFGERAAINAPIQGTASDIVKKAMIEIDQKLPLKMLLQVHDELIFEGTQEQLNEHLSKLISILEGVVQLKVPLKINYKFGSNWDEAH